MEENQIVHPIFPAVLWPIMEYAFAACKISSPMIKEAAKES
jgi:hypothetical protein